MEPLSKCFGVPARTLDLGLQPGYERDPSYLGSLYASALPKTQMPVVGTMILAATIS